MPGQRARCVPSGQTALAVYDPTATTGAGTGISAGCGRRRCHHVAAKPRTSEAIAASQPNSPTTVWLPVKAWALPLMPTAKLVSTSAFHVTWATTLGHSDLERSVMTPTKRVIPASATVNAGSPARKPYQPRKTAGAW